eukprot:m.361037 g.361037  ORF g.361037 m.361037 type:complete len:258 (-) comp28048_c0_seq2:413-1186(-)
MYSPTRNSTLTHTLSNVSRHRHVMRSHPSHDGGRTQVTRLSSTPELLAVARETVAQINTLNGWRPVNGLCMAWPPAAVVTENASHTLDMMSTALRASILPNFAPEIGSGCLAEQAGAVQAINDLLLQSYDGVLAFFPAGWDATSTGGQGTWSAPADGAGLLAGFTTLRARGAFLVSANWTAVEGGGGGVADGAEVLSEAGSNCSFVWTVGVGPPVVVREPGGNHVPLLGPGEPSPLGPIYTFATAIGGRYTLWRGKG